MTEQEYDEQIAPALLDLANKTAALGGSFVARVEWAKDESGITAAGIEKGVTGVGQWMTYIAANANGNLDAFYYRSAKQFDLSPTIVGMAMGWKPEHLVEASPPGVG